MKPLVNTLIFVLSLCVVWCLPGISEAQLLSKSLEEKQFEKGVEAYNNQQYEQSLQIFQDLYTVRGYNTLATATHLMLVKSYHRLGLDRQSITFGKQFLKQYARSSYRDDIYFSMAESYIALTQYVNAANYYTFSMTQSQDRALARIALDNLLKTTDAYLSMEEVQALVDGALSDQEESIYRLALLQEYILAGEMSLASTTAQEVAQSSISEIMQPTFQALTKAIKLEGDNSRLSIAVLAPLSGPSADVGKELLRGVRYALQEEPLSSRISVIPMDNTGTDLETVHQLQRIGQHDRVIAVIGPVWTDNVITGASLAGRDELPMITPTAAGNGLSALNPYVFQLSPDYETRGKAAAQYASDSLKLRTFATISPADPQGKALTDAFTTEVEQRGGEVLTQVWYSGIPEDLSDQLKHLRKIGFDLRAQYGPPVDTSEIVSDSLRSTLPDSEFVALFQERMEKRAAEIDSTEITLRHIDGMYFPIPNSDIDYIAPQFALYNFDTQVLGNVDWYDEGKLQHYASYIDSMLIFSDYYIPENTGNYRGFVTEFRKLTSASPTSLDLYGYDAMKLLLEQIRNGHSTRKSLTKALSNLHQVQGLVRTYTLDGTRQRVNQTLEVLRFTRRGLQKADVMTIGPRITHPMQTYFTK